MPELPETETLARDLHASVVGRTVRGVESPHADVLRGISARALGRRLAGRSFERVWRRAKAVVLELRKSGSESNSEIGVRVELRDPIPGLGPGSKSRNSTLTPISDPDFSFLVVVPRFTGGLLLRSRGAPDDRYDALRFRLTDGGTLAYRDVRRLGTVTVLDAEGFAELDRRLGQEPLDPSFTGMVLSATLKSSKQQVKKILMDQRRIAGIGNIYANESLWAAGIDPSRPGDSISDAQASALRDALVSVLRRSIAARGTTFRDFRDANGERGGFVTHLKAYGRGGQPCVRCGTRLTMTHAIDGRATVFCHRCQS